MTSRRKSSSDNESENNYRLKRSKSKKFSESDEDDEEETKHKKKKTKTKDTSWQEDPDLYGIRRSERKKENKKVIESSDDDRSRKKNKSLSSDNSNDDESDESGESEDSNFSTKLKKKTAKSKQAKRQTRSNVKKSSQLSASSESESEETSDDEEDDNSSDSDFSDEDNKAKKYKSNTSKPRKTASRRKSQINYCENDNSSDSEENDENEEQASSATFELPKPSDDGIEQIEKVLKYRFGRKGATGSKTTLYNVEENGNPNKDFDVNREDGEDQYLIKWYGWSHLHNTWESKETLLEQKAKGFKKFENFIKKEEELKWWRKEASPEDIEYYDCQSEMLDNLLETYTKVERIIAHKIVKASGSCGSGSTDYLCKWQGLPYAECTWEDGELIQKRFTQFIKEYEFRQQCQTLPLAKSNRLTRIRPRFVQLNEQPEYLGKKDPELILRDYQLDGLNWLANSWCKQNGVILADEMGLGKTIQSISFLSYLFNSHEVYGPFLVVIPLSTMQGWQKEFQRWTSEMNVVVYLGDANSRYTIQKYELLNENNKLRFNVVLTTYEILLKDKSFLSSIAWAALVVDEAHRLKNDDSLLYRTLVEFDTSHRLLITGTPLQNSLKELWALIHFIMPEKFDSWEDFDSKYSSVLKDGLKFQDLHKELAPYLLRRVKKDVEKSLPAKVEQILRVEMTKVQKQYSKLILSRNFKELSKGAKGNVSAFQNIMMELKKCCNHSYLIRRDDTSHDIDSILRGSGKLVLLDKLLRRLKETGHRVLIFSQMVRMLDIIAEYLQIRRFPFQRLDGSIKGEVRRQAIEHFNAKDSEDFCFLLSTRAGGLGINLATADTVIIYDSDWNPQNDLQAQARAHRIGQKNQVNIYRFITKNSIEESIIETAKRKMILDHLVIQRMDTTGRTVLDKNNPSNSTPFTKEEISSILKFRAEELFKKTDDENDKEEVYDIDEILKRAETKEDLNLTNAGEELLSQFKVANFSNMEDEIVNHKSSSKSWEEIIPEEDRLQVEHEEEEEFMKQLNLGKRVRTGKRIARIPHDGSDDDWNNNNDDSASSGSDDEKTKGNKKKTKLNGQTIKGFNAQEIRRFLRSFKKYPNPMQRIDIVAQDAQLDEKSRNELLELGSKIQTLCKIALNETNTGDFDKKKGPCFTLNNVNIYAQQIVDSEQYFEPLVHFFPLSKDKKFNFKTKLKQPHWDCMWEEQDDVSLLIGIYEYGYGNWEAIKLDQNLGLSEKILVENKRPQSKHLQTRVDYLMKVLLNQKNGTNSASNETSNSRRKSTRTENNNDENNGTTKKRTKPKATSRAYSDSEGDSDAGSDSNNHKRAKKTKKTKNKESDDENKKKKKELDEKIFLQCKDLMRPVKKALKNIDINESELSEKDHVERIQRHLLEIGDKINDILSKYSDPERIKEWRTNLWIFVSKFTTWSPDRLKEVYKKLSKTRDLSKPQSQESLDTPKQAITLGKIPRRNDWSSQNKNELNNTKKETNEYAQAGWCSSSNTRQQSNSQQQQPTRSSYPSKSDSKRHDSERYQSSSNQASTSSYSRNRHQHISESLNTYTGATKYPHSLHPPKQHSFNSYHPPQRNSSFNSSHHNRSYHDSPYSSNSNTYSSPFSTQHDEFASRRRSLNTNIDPRKRDNRPL